MSKGEDDSKGYKRHDSWWQIAYFPILRNTNNWNDLPTLDFNFIIRLTFISNVRIMRDESKVGRFQLCFGKNGSDLGLSHRVLCFPFFPFLVSKEKEIETRKKRKEGVKTNKEPDERKTNSRSSHNYL